MKQTRLEKIGGCVVAAILFLTALITLYPFWHVIMYSFSDSKAAMSGGIFLWPRQFTPLAYQLMFQSSQIFVAYKNTVIRTVGGTAISLTLSAMTAYPLSVRRLRGRGFFSMMIFFTMLFSGGMIPTFLVVQQLGMLDTLWALVIPGAVSAYNMFIMRNFFQSLPSSLEESAVLDGATPFRVLWSIVLPLSMPAIAAVGMFYGVGHWNSYIDAVLYINDTSKQVLQQYLRSLLATASALGSLSGIQDYSKVSNLTEETMKMATIAASVIPVLFVYPWLQKYYVKGVMIGSVKG